MPRYIFMSLLLLAGAAQAQSTSVSTEYLMTLYAPLEAPQAIDAGLTIYNVSGGGWVKGPKINGELLGPSADWLVTLPDGSSRLDVRGSLQTDDGALVYISYSGVISATPESGERFMAGEVMKAEELYFMTAPTFRTSSDRYAWLNHVQAVGKMVEVKAGEGAYVKYDIFAVK